ncbi:MAG: Crp/Fnr family transcriptional regulator [Actinomycetota bacterium]
MRATASVRSLPLTPPSVRLPEGLGAVRRLQRGEPLLTQGMPAPGLFVVRSGLLFESSDSPEGRWLLHDLLAPGDLSGTLPPDRCSATVRAAGPAQVRMLDPWCLDELFARRPALGIALLRALQRRADDAGRRVCELTWYAVPQRVILRLLDLARRHGRPVPGGVRIEITVTQEQLAAMVGAARETVNRALVRLIAEGLVRLEGRRFVIMDAATGALPWSVLAP